MAEELQKENKQTKEVNKKQETKNGEAKSKFSTAESTALNIAGIVVIALLIAVGVLIGKLASCLSVDYVEEEEIYLDITGRSDYIYADSVYNNDSSYSIYPETAKRRMCITVMYDGEEYAIDNIFAYEMAYADSNGDYGKLPAILKTTHYSDGSTLKEIVFFRKEEEDEQ